MTKQGSIHTECQWLGPEQEGPLYKPVCCRAVVAGRSYCADHLFKVYAEGTNLRRRHKDIRVANTVWDLEQAFQEAVEELEEEGYDFALERWD